MSSINRFKAPWPSSCNRAKAPPPDRRTLTPKAPSTGDLGSSLATADGTATTNRQAPRPWQGDGNASPLPSPVFSSPTPLNFRESRSPWRERSEHVARLWAPGEGGTADAGRRGPVWLAAALLVTP